MKQLVASLSSILLVAGLSFGGQASAQSKSNVVQPPPQAQQVQQGGAVDPNSVANWAMRVVAMVDRGELVNLWDGASSVARRSVKREDFVAGVQVARKPLGAVVGRDWLSVRKHRNTGSDGVPAGDYASVELAVLFKESKNQTRVELVTFRHDEDGRWRFTGYVIR